MKKRLLLILAIGISFAPVAFAGPGDAQIGAFTQPSTDLSSAGQIDCAFGIDHDKGDDGSAVSVNSDQGDSGSQSDSIN